VDVQLTKRKSKANFARMTLLDLVKLSRKV
jgi:hypothetical protein